MNYLTEKDIKSFELIFFDRSVDTGINDIFNFNIYPNSENSEIKQKFEAIEVLLKFMKTLAKNLFKDRVDIIIWKSVLKFDYFVSLCRDRIWDTITFDNCLIKNTKKIF